MRVLCFTNMYPTEREPWIGTFVRELVEDVRALGIDVDVLAFDGRGRKRAYAEAAISLRRALRGSRFDLVHAHYGLTGMVALAQRRIPTIVTFHGSDTGYVRWQGWVSWFVARLTTQVFVSRDGARRLGRPHAAVIPAGVDLELFRPRSRAEARNALGWPEHGRFLLLPGSRGNRRKNAPLFDAVVAELRRNVPEQLTPVSLEGLSREQTADVMNAVDATLMTSLFEGSPVAVKEALACLTPVVSVPVGDMTELVGDLPGCAIAPASPRPLADAVLRAFEHGRDPALRQRAEQYSAKRTAQNVVALYRELAGGRL
ncbi:MAG: glycosyltransferase family 4 protein [Gaiellaceae bacterium]